MADAQRPDPESNKNPRSIRYSEWFPREPNSIPVTVEVLQVNGATLKVELFLEKKDEEAKGRGDTGKI